MTRTEALTADIEALWRIPYPGPQNLLSAPAFTRLRDTCVTLYPNACKKDRLGIPLSNALRALGLPCGLPPSGGDLSLCLEDAAARLDVAFGQTNGRRLYLYPLDMADRIMPARVCRHPTGPFRRTTALFRSSGRGSRRMHVS
jgi:hypothetical protein